MTLALRSDFDEKKHPRADDGKFGSDKGSGGGIALMSERESRGALRSNAVALSAKGALRMSSFAVPVDDASLVKRPSAGAAPNEFRIWAAGENTSDTGSVFFTAKSAALLMAEQAARGRVYSSDFDHLSVLPNRPAEAGRASGWHRLAVRPDANGELELWAVDIEWCDDAKAGLEKDPPYWRFFSPTFRHTEDGEVTSYVNFALCINPLTHNLPSLAADIGGERKTVMTKKEAMAAMAKMQAEGCSEEDRKTAMKALAEYLEGAPDDKKEGEGEEKPETKKDAEPGQGAAEATEDPEKKPESAKDAEVQETKSVTSKMAADLVSATRRIDAFEIKELLDTRKDLPESVRKWCASQDLPTVKSFLASTPKLALKRNETPVVGDDATAPAGLQGAELEELNRLMGVRPALKTQFERTDDGGLVMHNVGPMMAQELAAKTARAGGSK